MKLALGLMSGTSGDGVSIALTAFGNKDFKTLGYKTYSYPLSLSRSLAKAANLKTPEISRLNVELGIYFAKCAVSFLKKNVILRASFARPEEPAFSQKQILRGVYTERSECTQDDIVVVGSHGHTIYHAGLEKPAHTFQIGEPSYLAEATGIPVVSDFRPRDIAAGGQGAPLIAYFDQFFFGGKARAMQNIGGIGNVTLVGSKKLIAFDTGPGNCLIDWAVQRMTRGKKNYDEGGKIAARGKILMGAVKKMAAYPYFKKRPPKSTGRELFNEKFIPASLKKAKPEDLIATLTYFTAHSIYESYRQFLPPIKEIVVSGGGALNQTLMTHLSKLFSPVPVLSVETFGMPAQAKEPIAFAFFALRALEEKTNHCPEGTGARHPAILGKITLGALR